MDIIRKVFSDIGWFLIIFGLILFLCASSFQVISYNIIEFDNLNDDLEPILTKEDLPFSTSIGAMWYVGMMCLGYFTFVGF